MATKPDTITGLITLTSGSVDFETTGTNLVTRGHLPGDEIYSAATGSWLIIETITGENEGTLRYPCPADCVGIGLPVTIRFQPDGSRVKAEARNLVDELGNGNIASLASLDGTGGQWVVTFAGPHSLELVPRTQFISGADYDVLVDDLAARAAYDGQPAGFTVLVADVGDGRSAIYSKNSLTSGDWSDPAYVTGPVGPMPILTVDDTVTLAPGSPATVTITPVLGGYELDFGIPEGLQGDTPTLAIDDVVTLAPGTPASVTLVPVTGGYEIDFGIPQGETGNGLEIDALGPLAGRSAYDTEPEGFVYFDTDTGELYLRYTAVSGVWEGPYPFQGPAGDSGSLITTTDGVGDGTIGPYTLDAAPIGLDSVLIASISGVTQYDFSVLGDQITFGQIIPVGIPWQVKSAGPLSVGVPADDSVDADKIDGSDAVAIRAKIGAGDVVGPASAVNDRIVTFDGTTGKLIKDSGKVVAALVEGPASAVDDRIATFDGTTGKLIQDSGLVASDLSTQVDMLSFYSVTNMETAKRTVGEPIFAGPDGNGIYDGLGTTTYVDVAGATNLDSSVVGKLKPTPSTTTIASAGPFGTPTDFSTFTMGDMSWKLNNSQTVTQLGFYSRTTTSITITLMIAKRNSPGNYDIVASEAHTYSVGADGWIDRTLTTPYAVPASGDYYVVIRTSATTASAVWAGTADRLYYTGTPSGTGVTFTEGAGNRIGTRATQITGSNNVTVSSVSVATSAPQTWAMVFAFAKLNTAVLNTDFIMSVSRNASTYLNLTMIEKYSRPDGTKLYVSGKISITGITSGTNNRWRWATANNKAPELYAVGLLLGT